ncbi:MAG: hypothetical protein GY804_15015 [Alphaproteobacteria bacterium]|nr:hypothetical protein [Alphaproteobacteria bacterium]
MELPKELRDRFGLKEPEKKVVRKVPTFDHLDEFTNEVVKENRSTIADLKKSRYTKSNTKMRDKPHYEEEHGQVMTVSDLTAWRQNALKEHTNAIYDFNDGFSVVIRIIQEMIRAGETVRNSSVMEVLSSNKRYRKLKAFKANFDRGYEPGVSSYVSAFFTKIVAAFGPDTTEYDNPGMIQDYPLVEKKDDEVGGAVGSQDIYYEFDLEFTEILPAQIKEVCNAKNRIDRKSRALVKKKKVEDSSDLCRRAKVLRSNEDLDFDTKDGFSAIVDIIQSFVKSNKEVNVPALFKEIRMRKKYRKLRAFKSCFDMNGNCTNASKGKSSISTMLSKVIYVFGPENPFGAEILAERFKVEETTTAGNQTYFVFRTNFLKYTPEQIKRTSVEFHSLRSTAAFKKDLAEGKLKSDIKEIFKDEPPQDIESSSRLSDLTIFRNVSLKLGENAQYEDYNVNHAVIKNIQVKVRKNKVVNLTTLYTVFSKLSNKFLINTFDSTKSKNIKVRISKIMDRLMGAFGPDKKDYGEEKVIDEPLVNKVRPNFIFTKEILGYKPAQIWFVVEKFEALEVEEEYLETIKKENTLNIAKVKASAEVEEVEEEEEPIISEETTNKLKGALDQFSKESDNLSNALALHTEPEPPAPPVRRSKGLLESNVDDIIESLKESGGGSLNVSITIDVKGKK